MRSISSLHSCLLLLTAICKSRSSLAYVGNMPMRPSMVGHSLLSAGRKFKTIPEFSSPRSNLSLKMSSSGADPDSDDSSLRTRLRNLTGFSFTALRATLRATTGISLTAIRVAVGATTSRVFNKVVSTVVGVFPTWFRYFLQPFLVLYYTPLMIIRCLVGPSKTFWKDERATHEAFVEGWKMAVAKAEEKQHGGYWPVHVDEETGVIEPMLDSDHEDVDVVDAVAESVEVAMSNGES